MFDNIVNSSLPNVFFVSLLLFLNSNPIKYKIPLRHLELKDKLQSGLQFNATVTTKITPLINNIIIINNEIFVITAALLLTILDNQLHVSPRAITQRGFS